LCRAGLSGKNYLSLLLSVGPDIALAIEANDIFVAALERIRDLAQGIIIDQ
jgi:hypothetical protein